MQSTSTTVSESDFNASHPPLACHLNVLNLSYKVIYKNNRLKKEKYLLRNVSITASPGEILGVMGPSGAGKSTFLDAIAGQIQSNSLEGRILVNGKPMDSSFKRLSGYVMQDDALFPTLTVRETLTYSAKLRLPRTMSLSEKKERVENMILKLGLTSCAGTVVGNHELRGVSGGEKRRVSIGVDLIHDPSVLFLDEPTSGLDSTAALKVVQILYSMAEERNRTIVLTIHQPSYRMLSLIHKVLVLAHGSAIYQGSYCGLADYFEGFGKKVPQHVNMLEFTLDLVEEEQKKENGLTELIAYSESQRRENPNSSSERYNIVSANENRTISSYYANNVIQELAILVDRNFKTVFRTKALFLGRSVLLILTALTIGSVFFRLGFDLHGVKERQSYFAFIVALVYFTSTEGLPIFLDERQIFLRETSRGAYRTASYVVGGALVFLPFLLLLAGVHFSVAYFMVGLSQQAHAAAVYVAIIFASFAVANSFVLLISASVSDFISANTVITSCNAYFFLFSGYYISKDHIPKYLIWIHYISSFKYPMEMLASNEFRSQANQCWRLSSNSTRCSHLNEATLKSFSIDKVNIFFSMLTMIGLFLAYRVLFYVVLRKQAGLVRK